MAEMRRLLRGDIDGNEEAVSAAMQGLFEAHPGGVGCRACLRGSLQGLFEG